jgi:ferritin-like protein
MAGASTTLHESESVLSPETRDIHRALVSIQEELEAVDWYRQRAEAAGDGELREILLHNMREEIEHASMLLEWLRRHEPHADLMFRTYLFTDKPVTVIEEEAEQASTNGTAHSTPVPPLTVGTMKGG